ncbi:MAG: hypothetical protein HY890_09205 [Deltaproteobacteria bacterium]|nr:hypothetical protein [Deltaproteobacteria bacterium]
MADNSVEINMAVDYPLAEKPAWPAGGPSRTANGPAEVRDEAKTKGGFAFEWFLIATVFLAACAGIYESLTESSMPAWSMLSMLRGHGYLKKYSIAYEPGRGVWRTLGWTGSAMMLGLMLYSLRKRIPAMRRLGSMRHWLSAHMFLGIMGPLLVTMHTTFKWHGIIATSFWCMIVTMVFGILGRYIYGQIPRGISGAELEVKDIEKIIEGMDKNLAIYLGAANPPAGHAGPLTAMSGGMGVLDANPAGHAGGQGGAPGQPAGHAGPLGALFFTIKSDIIMSFRMQRAVRLLKTRYKLAWRDRRKVISILKKRTELIRRKNLLATSHSLLHHWHVLHVPLALVMFTIMFLHIAVYYIFRTGQ